MGRAWPWLPQPRGDPAPLPSPQDGAHTALMGTPPVSAPRSELTHVHAALEETRSSQGGFSSWRLSASRPCFHPGPAQPGTWGQGCSGPRTNCLGWRGAGEPGSSYPCTGQKSGRGQLMFSPGDWQVLSQDLLANAPHPAVLHQVLPTCWNKHRPGCHGDHNGFGVKR